MRSRARITRDLEDLTRRLHRVLDADARARKPPRRNSVHVRMTDGELGQLRARSSARGMTISAYVCALVDADALPDDDE